MAVASSDSAGPASPTSHASLPEGTATIPFELLEGLVLVRGTASGSDSDTTGDFVLDTGAGFLALDAELAHRLGIADESGKPDDVGIAARPLRRLVLGDQTMDLVQPVLTIDGGIIRRVTDRSVLGLLGTRLYDDRALQVDYVARVIRLVPARAVGEADTMGGGDRVADATITIARSREALGAALASTAVAVPFTLAGDGKILVRARLGVSRFASSKPLTLILDTGATKTVLFRAALRSQGVDAERWPRLCGLSVPTLFGAPSACLVRMPSVSLESYGMDLPGESSAAGSAEAPAPAEPAPADATATAAEGTKATATDVATRRMRPAVRAMLGDKAPGAGRDKADAARDGDIGRTVEPAPSAPALRSRALRASDLDAILMESELQQVLSRVVETPVHGLLGYTFLRHYRVTIDYPRRIAWFEPARDPDPRPFEYSHPGIQIERDGPALRVVAVAEGSPAAKAKIAVGETLVSVDGRAVAGQDLAQVARWLEGEPGTRVRLEIGSAAGTRAVELTRRRLL